jgi:hypothetical protein
VLRYLEAAELTTLFEQKGTDIIERGSIRHELASLQSPIDHRRMLQSPSDHEMEGNFSPLGADVMTHCGFCTADDKEDIRDIVRSLAVNVRSLTVKIDGIQQQLRVVNDRVEVIRKCDEMCPPLTLL